MTPRSTAGASGMQVAILIIALLVVGAAADRYLFRPLQMSRDLGRIATFLAAAAILLGVPGLRRACAALLANPIPRERRTEVGLVLALAIVLNFAVLGAAALAWWSLGGEPALATRMGALGMADGSAAFSFDTLARTFLLGAVLAPVVEELAFRGFLYRAWEAQLGWFPAAIATSLVFGLIHPYVVPQFLVSLLLVGLYRRTGSLRACIAVHCLMNVSHWHPLLGQFIFPTSAAAGGIAAWSLHLAALAVASIALLVYLWMARAPQDGKLLLGHGPAALT
jgi:CAAX amino terminal protease family.